METNYTKHERSNTTPCKVTVRTLAASELEKSLIPTSVVACWPAIRIRNVTLLKWAKFQVNNSKLSAFFWIRVTHKPMETRTGFATTKETRVSLKYSSLNPKSSF